jgi:hypothetical protein
MVQRTEPQSQVLARASRRFKHRCTGTIALRNQPLRARKYVLSTRLTVARCITNKECRHSHLPRSPARRRARRGARSVAEAMGPWDKWRGPAALRRGEAAVYAAKARCRRRRPRYARKAGDVPKNDARSIDFRQRLSMPVQPPLMRGFLNGNAAFLRAAPATTKAQHERIEPVRGGPPAIVHGHPSAFS